MSLPTLQSIAADWTPGATGVWGIFLLIGAHYLKIWLDTRKLSAEQRQANREGFAAQVALLQTQLNASNEENRLLRQEQRADREATDQYRRLCQEETESLRNHIIEAEDNFAGVLRKIATLARRVIQGQTDADIASALFQIISEATPETIRQFQGKSEILRPER